MGELDERLATGMEIWLAYHLSRKLPGSYGSGNRYSLNGPVSLPAGRRERLWKQGTGFTSSSGVRTIRLRRNRRQLSVSLHGEGFTGAVSVRNGWSYSRSRYGRYCRTCHRSRRVNMWLPSISIINRARCDRWHKDGEPWMASDWSNALAGETGELCNVIKKIRRHETGAKQAYNTPDMETCIADLKDEIADVFLYLDLVAYHFGLDLEECIFPKFNRVSKAQGFPERMGE